MRRPANWRLIALFTVVLLLPLFGQGQVNLDSGLVAYYPFNENADDESGNGNDGTLIGGATTFDVLKIGDNDSRAC